MLIQDIGEVIDDAKSWHDAYDLANNKKTIYTRSGKKELSVGRIYIIATFEDGSKLPIYSSDFVSGNAGNGPWPNGVFRGTKINEGYFGDAYRYNNSHLGFKLMFWDNDPQNLGRSGHRIHPDVNRYFGNQGCTSIQDNDIMLKRFYNIVRLYLNDQKFIYESINLKNNPNYNSNGKSTNN